MALLQSNANGLYCEAGDFYVDPWRAVDRALITHAHSDHARPGCGGYLCAEPAAGTLRARVGQSSRIETLPYGATREILGVQVSFHPAGHVLGSAQIRLELRGEVWVVSGDYKTQPDSTCTPFEPVSCDVFITESTFGLPVYRWPSPQEVRDEINAWWRSNQDHDRVSVLFGYSLGKAQRLLAGLDPGLGPIFVHGAVAKFLPVYAQAGIVLPKVAHATAEAVRAAGAQAIVVAPPSADQAPWLHPFGETSTAFASGWMQLRGARRWRGADRGFVVSDHADWEGLLSAIAATGAQRILVTHGYAQVLVRWLREQGLDAEILATRFTGEPEEAGESE